MHVRCDVCILGDREAGLLPRTMSSRVLGIEGTVNDQAAVERAEFAEAVARLRRAHGWSQERLSAELAELARTALGPGSARPPTRQTVSRWEAGQRMPDRLNGYLLCRLFRKAPEELGLHRIVTPSVMEKYRRRQEPGNDAPFPIDQARRIDNPAGLDWERLGFVLRAMRPVDARTVEDQWMLTNRYLADRRRVRPRGLLDVMVEHVVRLRQLRIHARDDRLRRELTVMLCETLIAAGAAWTGLTDFGMAILAHQEAEALAGDLGEEWLRVTALLAQAQLSGGHASAPWTPAVRRQLLEQSEGTIDGVSPQARAWLYTTRAQLHALLGEPRDAQRSLELAIRSQALAPASADPYFAMAHPVYIPLQEASIMQSTGHPAVAADRFRRIIESIEPDATPIRTWASVYLAHAEAAAGGVENAADTLNEVSRMVRELDSPLLEHSIARIVVRDPWTVEHRLRSGKQDTD